MMGGGAITITLPPSWIVLTFSISTRYAAYKFVTHDETGCRIGLERLLHSDSPYESMGFSVSTPHDPGSSSGLRHLYMSLAHVIERSGSFNC
jgi:hypothetical protein